MNQSKPTFLKFISVIQRNTQKYFDSILEDYHIGGGQQFFLVHIYENDGITMYDLARLGQFDKATVTKAVRKLEELGYVEVRTDKTDRRIRHLFTTEKAAPVVKRTYEVRKLWRESLIEELAIPEEEIYRIFKSMAEQSCRTLEKLSEKKHVEKGEHKIE